jgi:hypothetical protein
VLQSFTPAQNPRPPYRPQWRRTFPKIEEISPIAHPLAHCYLKMATSVTSATAAVQRTLHKACFASGSRPPPRTLQPKARNGDAEPHGAQQAAMRLPAEVPLAATPSLLVARRAALGLGASALLLSLWPTSGSAVAATDATELLPASIQLALTPDQRLYDASDPQLRAAAQLLQQALNASDVVEEEALWSKIIADYGALKQNWVPDLVGRVSGCTLWLLHFVAASGACVHSACSAQRVRLVCAACRLVPAAHRQHHVACLP